MQYLFLYYYLLFQDFIIQIFLGLKTRNEVTKLLEREDLGFKPE